VVVRVGAAAAEASRLPAEGATRTETIVEKLAAPPDRFLAQRAGAAVRGVAGGGADRRAAAPAGKDKPGAGRDEGETTGSEPPPLPLLREGQRLDGTFAALAKQTRPRHRTPRPRCWRGWNTPGARIADETLRAAMRDFGLGTPATRAATNRDPDPAAGSSCARGSSCGRRRWARR